MDAYRIHEMLEDVSEAASTELAKGTEKINTKEFGEVIDMIKDLTEAEKNKMEACYYKSIIEAMEESEYGEDYDYEGRIRKGYSRGGRRMGYEQPMMYDDRYMDYMDGRVGYSNGAYGGGSMGMSRQGYSQGSQGGFRSNQSGQRSSRYGFSHDEYMKEKSMYNKNNPEDMKKRAVLIEDRMDDLYAMVKEEVKDMTPEEKQMWKSKISGIVNI